MTMLKRIGRKVAPAAWILFAAGSAAAAESGPYVGADLGEALYPQGAYWRPVPGSLLYGNRLDTTDFAWSFRAGYRFNRFFGLEAGYVNLGGYSGPLTDRVNAAAGHGNMSFSAKGETLAALGALERRVLLRLEPRLKSGDVKAGRAVEQRVHRLAGFFRIPVPSFADVHADVVGRRAEQGIHAPSALPKLDLRC